MAVWRNIERSRGRLVHELHDYWNAKRAGRPMPVRADLDPTEIKHLLPNLLIVDITTDPFRVRYRLIGTKVVGASGIDFTGSHLDEMIPADNDAPWESCYRLAWAEKQPVFGDTDLPTLDGGTVTYEFGIFPLGRDSVTQCVSLEDYGPLNDRLFELQERAQPWQPRSVKLRNSDTDA